MNETKAEIARKRRYKRPALQMLQKDRLFSELDEMLEKCGDVAYFTSDEETLLNALDGNEEEAFEFKMAFSSLESSCESLSGALQDTNVTEYFDDFLVGILGNRYNMVGYDAMEEDYFSLASYEKHAALTEAGERLMRLTKAQMISVAGQCLGIFIAFIDLRDRYDSLKSVFDILLDQNTSLLKQVKDIEELYEKAVAERFGGDATQRLANIVSMLPDYVLIG